MKDSSNPQSDHALPAQKAMKQTSKTSSERDDGSDQQGASPKAIRPVRKGDAPVGTTDNQGSSPYGDAKRNEKT